MKKVLWILLCLFLTNYSFSQDLRNKGKIVISATGGISNPTSTFKQDGFADTGSYYELETAYFFSNLGLSFSLGNITNNTKSTFSNIDAANALGSEVKYPFNNSVDQWQGTYIGIGPVYSFRQGKFTATISAKYEDIAIKPIRIEISAIFDGTGSTKATKIPVYFLSQTNTTHTSFYSTGLNLGYKLSNNITLSINTKLRGSLSGGINMSTGKKIVEDSNKNGIIDEVEFEKYTSSDSFILSSKKIKPQYFNYGIGLSYTFDTQHIFGSSKNEVKQTLRDTTRIDNGSVGGDILLVKRTGRNPQTGATINTTAKKVVKFKAGTASVNTVQRVYGSGDAHYGNTTKTATLKKLADELVNLATKENPNHHGDNLKYADLKKLADELVNLAAKENPNHHGDNLKYADLKKLADELVNLAVKENPNHHGDNLEYADLKKLADELVNLATKDSVGNISPNVKENPVKKKPIKRAARTGRNPQTGATFRGKQQLKLINLFPKNNSNYKSLDEIKKFTWQLVGEKIPNPKYVIEIIKIGSKKQADITYSGETANTRIYAKKVVKFKAGTASSNTVNRNANNNGSFGEGHYKWRVTETSTGISSGYSFFSVSNCNINLTISNDTIECLGYVGANRKFKICFDATYSSASGNLTYANGGSGSGLKVYDQSNNSLSYTLVSPNTTLQTQNGSTTSTISYCFEVTVPSTVTSISYGLQGDDLNINSNYTCQPAANLDIDKLPSCICNDCDRIQTKLTDIKITPKDSLGNQYNISSNISVNVPIYGLEFQVQSYSYNSIPNSCSQGVNSIEQSGMILMPVTTVNGSTSLQLFNETISGSSTTNNHATKVVKYTSNTPLTGPIPINLTIGLPGPLAGLNADCCKMSYQVCVKVIIYYNKDSSKSCVFTKCFNFNNQ